MGFIVAHSSTTKQHNRHASPEALEALLVLVGVVEVELLGAHEVHHGIEDTELACNTNRSHNKQRRGKDRDRTHQQ